MYTCFHFIDRIISVVEIFLLCVWLGTFFVLTFIDVIIALSELAWEVESPIRLSFAFYSFLVALLQCVVIINSTCIELMLAKIININMFVYSVFPKTDYTYSRHSPFNGKQVSPGIPVVPNMSRKPVSTPYRNKYRGNYYFYCTNHYLIQIFLYILILWGEWEY